MNPIQLLRMRRWLRRPPSLGRVTLIVAAIVAALVIWGIDQAGLWPDWAKTERIKRTPVRVMPVGE